MNKLTWVKAIGCFMTPGGDPTWECPKCHSDKSVHCMGIETEYNYRDKCPNCEVELKYPFELEK